MIRFIPSCVALIMGFTKPEGISNYSHALQVGRQIGQVFPEIALPEARTGARRSLPSFRGSKVILAEMVCGQGKERILAQLAKRLHAEMAQAKLALVVIIEAQNLSKCDPSLTSSESPYTALWDPLNISGQSQLFNLTGIDEYGVVRLNSQTLSLKEVERFAKQVFKKPHRPIPKANPLPLTEDEAEQRYHKSPGLLTHREYADWAAMWDTNGFTSGRFDKAINSYYRTLHQWAFGHDDPESRFRVGVCHWMMNDQKSARAEIELAVALRPNQSVWRQRLRELKEYMRN